MQQQNQNNISTCAWHGQDKQHLPRHAGHQMPCRVGHNGEMTNTIQTLQMSHPVSAE